MIDDLATTFGSKTKAREIALLLGDAKRVVRQGFYQEELGLVEDFCQKYNLTLVTSKFKVLLADDTSYSNKGIKVEADHPKKGMFFVYLSKDPYQAWLASLYELKNEQEEFGRILGYPKCCIDFFCKRFTPDNPNLQLTPQNPWTNLSKRSKDAVLLSHFPCASDCQDSIILAKKYAQTLLKQDEQDTRNLLFELEV